MKKNFNVSVGLGAPSLLTIFLILSLVSFSVLSFMTAQADYRFTRTLERRTDAYFTTSNAAEIIIHELRLELIGIQPNSANVFQSTELLQVLDSFTFEKEREIVENGELYNVSYSTMEETVTLLFRMLDTQDLQVTLRLELDVVQGIHIVVTRWVVVPMMDWNPDTTLNLL